MHDIYPSKRSDGNWYVLAAGLPSPTKPLVLAPGLSVRPLSSKLTVFDLAAAGGVGFREWATLEVWPESLLAWFRTTACGRITVLYDNIGHVIRVKYPQ